MNMLNQFRETQGEAESKRKRAPVAPGGTGELRGGLLLL